MSDSARPPVTAAGPAPLGFKGARRRVERGIEHVLEWADDQFEISRGLRKMLDHIFPDHWSFMLGEIALYCFVVLVLTGVFLALYFDPSHQDKVYWGSYAPLRSQHVSAAYASTVDISFSVRNGLLFRQMHHWAADIFIFVIVVHMCRVFFTGAFRKPRATNWVIGATMLFLAIINGYAGYSLPDDLMSGTGLRIGYSIIESMPLIGSYLAVFLFGGQFPGDGRIEYRLFIAHVFIIPALIAVLLAVHLSLIYKQKHTQFAQPGRTELNTVGSPMFPRYMLKSIGLFALVTGVLSILAGLAQVNPIWQFGHYEPYMVSYASQPDWYMGWIEGAMRIMPFWEWEGFGHTAVFVIFLPAVVLPVVTYLVLAAWPLIESRMTKDRTQHHLLQRPRENPVRTSIGVGILVFYAVLFFAASDDLIANFFDVPLESVVWGLRICTVVLPFVVGYPVHRICVDLRRERGTGGEVVLADDHYLLEPDPPPEEHELEPEPVPTIVLPGPVTVTVPAADG